MKSIFTISTLLLSLFCAAQTMGITDGVYADEYVYNSISAGLKSPKNVKKLIIQDCEEFDPKILSKVSKFTNAESIEIYANGDYCADSGFPEFIQIPESWGQLESLNTLTIHDMNASSLDPYTAVFTYFKDGIQGLEKLQNLKVLNLWTCSKLSNIPSQVFELESLEKLSIYKAPISVIPDEISRLSKLQELYLEELTLEAFPNSICSLNNLNHLSLVRCNLSEIPDNLSALNQLISIGLRENKLKEIPTAITNMRNLQILDLSYNEINNVVLEFPNLASLEVLKLNHNFIQNFEGSFCSKIKRLFLSNNLLTEFKVPEKPCMFQELWLDDNKITSLDFIGPDLEIFSGSNNFLNSFPTCLTHKGYEYLNCSQNFIPDFPDWILEQFSYIYLGENFILNPDQKYLDYYFRVYHSGELKVNVNKENQYELFDTDNNLVQVFDSMHVTNQIWFYKNGDTFMLTHENSGRPFIVNYKRTVEIEKYSFFEASSIEKSDLIISFISPNGKTYEVYRSENELIQYYGVLSLQSEGRSFAVWASVIENEKTKFFSIGDEYILVLPDSKRIVSFYNDLNLSNPLLLISDSIQNEYYLIDATRAIKNSGIDWNKSKSNLASDGVYVIQAETFEKLNTTQFFIFNELVYKTTNSNGSELDISTINYNNRENRSSNSGNDSNIQFDTLQVIWFNEATGFLEFISE